ncbi:hypothetical protein NPIL_563411 [Nephila pilipes]|uniref:Uncharacterized protein n=1 Tax=Nephila pilipes TaxID=299642 RepID=A0A8X6U6K8_NEPPI|nr:hypothetical protein NPIL_563411 [Nephila pilipes]
MQGGTRGTVSLFEPIGEEKTGLQNIGTEKYLVVAMHDGQEKLLELSGRKCVMIDSTYRTNQNGFQLTTLMVHSENLRSIPFTILYFFTSNDSFSFLQKNGLLTIKEIRVSIQHGIGVLALSNEMCGNWVIIDEKNEHNYLITFKSRCQEIVSLISIERSKLTPRVALIRMSNKANEEMVDDYGSIQCDKKHIVTKTEGESIFTYNIEEVNEIC